MNPNERSPLLIVLLLVLVAGLGFIAYNVLWVPLQNYNREIAKLHKDNDASMLQVAKILKDRDLLAAWRLQSLPGVENLAREKGKPITAQDRDNAIVQAQDVYVTYLRNLLIKHKIAHEYPRKKATDAKGVPQVAPGVPVYTSLQFTVDGKATAANMAAMLKEFRDTPLLQRVRDLTVKREDGTPGGGKKKGGGGDPLGFTMTVEALVVHEAARRGTSLLAAEQRLAALNAALIGARRAPLPIPWTRVVLAATTPDRSYADLGRKNIFDGAPPPQKQFVKGGPKERPLEDLISFTRLTDVTIGAAAQASADNLAVERPPIRLRLEAGSNTIPLLKSGEGWTLIYGQVARIDHRGVLFQVKLDALEAAEAPSKMTDPDQIALARYRNKEKVYQLHAADVEALVKEKLVKADEAERLFKVHRKYWDGMVRDRAVLPGKGNDFAFRWELVRGKVVKRDDKFVVLKLDEKYCSFRRDEKSPRVSPHQGYCMFGLNMRLVDALQNPMEPSKVREILTATGQGGAMR